MAAEVSRRAGAGVGGPGGSAPARKGWTAGRLASLAAGSVLILLSAVLLAGAGVLTWATRSSRAAT